MKLLNSKLYRQQTLGFFEDTGTIEHVELAEDILGGANQKSLAQKNSGKFYTPEPIARPLIDQAFEVAKLASLVGKVRIIDPFCGDGRLLTLLLPKLADLDLDLEIHLWDYDELAVSTARTALQRQSKKLGMKCIIDAKKTDSFSEFFNGWEGHFDLVITNPPWEVIKPDPKDLKQIIDPQKREQYVASLKNFSDRIFRNFPLSRPSKTYGGWGVNLARVGTEISIRLAREQGTVAIVTPSTILADQNSFELRRWIFSENGLSHLNVYPAELKMFAGVDQPCVSFILQRNNKKELIQVTNYQSLLRPEKSVVKNIDDLLASLGGVFPVAIIANAKHLDLLSSLSKLPKLFEQENRERLWVGRELDETNHKSWIGLKGRYPFVKGRNIGRFENPPGKDIFINEKTFEGKIPQSVKFYRIVWRDVSRPNQKRRIIATLLPPGYVTGNSLGVLHTENTDYQKKLGALLAMISSLVFEFQLRGLLATAHISAGVMRKIAVPQWTDDLIEKLSSLTEARMGGEREAENMMEIYVAKAYGLKYGQFTDLLDAFPKLSSDEKGALLNADLWGI